MGGQAKNLKKTKEKFKLDQLFEVLNLCQQSKVISHSFIKIISKTSYFDGMNTSAVLLYIVFANSSLNALVSSASCNPDSTSSTCLILHGSLRPFTITPGFHFSFLTLVTCNDLSLRYFADACVGRISHQGASVSIMSLSIGICRTTSIFASVFNEHPLMPIRNPSSIKRFASS